MNRFLLFLFVVTVTIGCKKDEQEEEIPKQEYIDSVLYVENGNNSFIKFDYNKNNKLNKLSYDRDEIMKLEYFESGEVAICDTYYNWPLDPSKKVREYLVLTYDDSNKLKSGILKRYVNSIFVDKTECTYKLNDLNQVVELLTDNPEIEGEIITYDQNGNVSTIEKGGIVTTYTYNNKNSYLRNSKLNYYLAGTYLPVDLVNKNDIIKSVETFHSNTNEEVITSEYSEDEFPISSDVTYNNFGTINTEKRFYKYILK